FSTSATGRPSISRTASSSSAWPSSSPRCSPLIAPLAIRVPEDAAGERLDRFLAALPEVGSRGAAERLLAAGAVRVDDEPGPKSHRLSGGEGLQLDLAPVQQEPLAPEGMDIKAE